MGSVHSLLQASEKRNKKMKAVCRAHNKFLVSLSSYSNAVKAIAYSIHSLYNVGKGLNETSKEVKDLFLECSEDVEELHEFLSENSSPSADVHAPKTYADILNQLASLETRLCSESKANLELQKEYNTASCNANSPSLIDLKRRCDTSESSLNSMSLEIGHILRHEFPVKLLEFGERSYKSWGFLGQAHMLQHNLVHNLVAIESGQFFGQNLRSRSELNSFYKEVRAWRRSFKILVDCQRNYIFAWSEWIVETQSTSLMSFLVNWFMALNKFSTSKASSKASRAISKFSSRVKNLKKYIDKELKMRKSFYRSRATVLKYQRRATILACAVGKQANDDKNFHQTRARFLKYHWRAAILVHTVNRKQKTVDKKNSKYERALSRVKWEFKTTMVEDTMALFSALAECCDGLLKEYNKILPSYYELRREIFCA